MFDFTVLFILEIRQKYAVGTLSSGAHSSSQLCHSCTSINLRGNEINSIQDNCIHFCIAKIQSIYLN